MLLFQTTSLLSVLFELSTSEVPPTPVTFGSLAGDSAWTGPFSEPLAPGVEPSSPVAAKIETPALASSVKY